MPAVPRQSLESVAHFGRASTDIRLLVGRSWREGWHIIAAAVCARSRRPVPSLAGEARGLACPTGAVGAERLEQLTDEELAEVAELAPGPRGRRTSRRSTRAAAPRPMSHGRSGCSWPATVGARPAPGAEATAEAAVCHRDWQLGLGAATLDEARDVCIEGHGGLLEILDRRDIPHKWNRSLFELQFLETGSKLSCFSGEDAESWRGPNFHWVWCDELAKWAQAAAAWDVLYAAVRRRDAADHRHHDPETDAPSAPAAGMESTYFTGGAPTDNVANLAPGYVGDLRPVRRHPVRAPRDRGCAAR